MNEFAKYHPLINFIYFTAVIVFSMIFVHPICLVTSLLCSVMYSVILNGKKALKFIAMLLPLMLISALINPAFNHEGVTVIAYLPSGNPLTLESILYGIVAASMVATVICWFSCFNKIMTSDKFIYLFGRIIPSLSLILSMTFRFVPKISMSSTYQQRITPSPHHGDSTHICQLRSQQSLQLLKFFQTSHATVWVLA